MRDRQPVEAADAGQPEEVLSRLATLNIHPGHLDLAQLRAGMADGARIAIDGAAMEGIAASARLVREAAEGDAAVYGVNTGFGKLANQRIAPADLALLQLNLLRSHAVGVGEPLPVRVVRLTL